jgi:alpha-D-xyloside xylohydrolase
MSKQNLALFIWLIHCLLIYLDDDYSVILDPPLDGPETSPIGTSYSTVINATQNATLTNGYASVVVTENQLSFYRVDENNNQTLVLQELWLQTPGFPARWYQKRDARRGYRAQFSFVAPDSPKERLFGTGHDLTGALDKKNQTIDLVKFNTLNPIPTIMSNRGYLFFWNVPSLGQMELSPTRYDGCFYARSIHLFA